MTLHRPGLLLSAAALLLVAGCAGGGVAEVADDDAFATCVQDAGLDLGGADDWSEAEERQFLSRPAALDCVVDAVPDDERAAVLERAFPEVEGFDDDDRRLRFAPTEALVDYTEAELGSRPVPQVLQRVAELMNALGWDEEDESWPAREQVALTVVRVTDGVPGYDEWLRDNGVKDDYTGRAAYLVDAANTRPPFYDRLATLRDDLLEAQGGA